MAGATDSCTDVKALDNNFKLRIFGEMQTNLSFLFQKYHGNTRKYNKVIFSYF